MTQHLAECFVGLSRLCFTSQPLAELCFDHAESPFHVAALVIVNQKILTLETVIVKQLFPKLAAALSGHGRFERM